MNLCSTLCSYIEFHYDLMWRCMFLLGMSEKNTWLGLRRNQPWNMQNRSVRSVVWCDFGPFLAKTITAPYLIFAVTCTVLCIRYGLNGLKSIYFSNFGFFLPSQKLIFPFVLGQVLNYWASFSLFWVDFLNQHLLGLSNFFFSFFN